MADLGTLNFGVHLKDYTDAEVDKIKKKLENLSIKLNIDASSSKVSNTDSIKKQIEDAIKNININSVKVDANAVKTQIESATQNLSPKITVTLLKGSLSNDIQTYLDTKVFKINLSITKSQVDNAIKSVGIITVPATIKVSPKVALSELKKSLSNISVPIGVNVKSGAELVKDIKDKLKDKKVAIGITTNKSELRKSVTDALRGKTFHADLKLNIRSLTVQEAIRQAFAKAGLNYNTSASDVRAARVAEIQQRMAMRAANANRNLANSHRQAASATDQFARASVTLSNGLHTNIRLGGQLGTVLGNFASVFGIKDLLQDVIRIGGQLENQRIALGAILQDGGKATAMFSKIQSLAVKSPFGIMDLNQYVKQLSAYQVPYNELYDTMKRLADISAGVGVDMGRIILAFGQVKAAGFLKGTELRQFTEANIPMVQALADRFTELRGEIVSAAEVYDMISKKKVTFEDVKSVLWDLTDEGGMFNNMQEVLSESLASKWKNLADAVDVMFGKIADGWVGSGLKSMAEGLTELTKGWQYVATAIGAATLSFAAYKTSVAIGTKQMAAARGTYSNLLASKQQEAAYLRQEAVYRKLNKAELELIKTSNQLTRADIKKAATTGQLNKAEALRLITLGKLNKEMLKGSQALLGITNKEIAAAQGASRLKIAWLQLGNGARALGAALKSLFLNPWTIGFTVFTAIMEGITFLVSKSNELKDITKEAEESAVGSMQTIGKELDKLKDINIGELDDTAIKIQIKNLTTLIQNEAPYWQGILAEVFKQDADGNFVKTGKEQLEELIKKINEVQKAKQMLAENSDVVSGIIDESWSYSQWDNFGGFMRDFEKSVINAEKKLDGLTKYYSIVDGIIHSIVEGNEELSEKLSGKSIQQQVLILEKYPQIFSLFKENLKNSPDIAHIIKTYEDAIKYAYEDKGDWGRIFDTLGVAKDNIWSQLTKYGYKEGQVLDETARQIVMDAGNRLETYAKVSHSRVLNKFWETFLKPFGLSRQDFEVPKDITDLGGDTNDNNGGSGKDAVAEMWKKRVDEIEKAVAAYDKWKKIEGALNAENRIKGEKEFANLFNGAYGFNLMLENPTSAYEYVQSQLNEKLEKQRELYLSLGVKISDAEFKDAEDEFKIALNRIKDEVKKATERWNFFEEMFKRTGNKELSMNIAFGGDIGFERQADELRYKIEKALKSQETEISFNDVIKFTDKELEESGLSLLKEYIDEYNKAEQNQWKETSSRLMKAVEENMAYNEKVKLIQKQASDDIAAIEKQRTKENSEYVDTLIENRKKLENQELNSLAWSEFKKSDNYVKVFERLDRMPIQTIEKMIEDLEKMKGSLSDLKLTELKELINALEKLKKEVETRNPFKVLSDSLDKIGKNSKDNNAWVELGVGIESSVKLIKEMSQEFSSAFELMGITASEQGKKVLDGLENLGMGLAKVAESYGKQDWIGMASGLLSAASGMAKIYSGMFSDKEEKAAEKQFLLDLIRLQTEYNSKLVETKLLNDDIWDNTKINDAVDAVEALSEAVGYYNELLDTQVEKHQDPSGGFWKNMGKWNFWNPFGWWSSGFGAVVDGGNDKEMVSIMKNLRYITKTPNMFRHTQTVDLVEWLKNEGWGDLFDEDGRLNLDLATTIKDWDRLTKETKEYLENLIEAEEVIQKAEGELSSYISDTFGELGNSLSDSIIDAFRNGTDAAESFRDSVVSVLEDVGAQILRSVFLSDIFNNYQSELEDIYKNYAKDKDKEKFAKEMAEVTSVFFNEAQNSIELGTEWLEQYKDIMSDFGFDVFEPNQDSGSLSKGIKSITENTADLLASYLNGIRADVSVKRSLIEKLIADDIPQMSVIAQAQLTQLNNIAANTLRNADAADRIYDLFNRVVDKGGNKLKI